MVTDVGDHRRNGLGNVQNALADATEVGHQDDIRDELQGEVAYQTLIVAFNEQQPRRASPWEAEEADWGSSRDKRDPRPSSWPAYQYRLGW